MDTRLSPEQEALRESVVHVVERWRPTTVGMLGDGERVAKLDAAMAASGWRQLRSPTDEGAPWASGVEAAIVAEEFARGLADAAFVGPTLAVDLRRLVDAPSAASNETVALTADLVGPGDRIAIDAAGASGALVVRDGDVAAARVDAPLAAVDLTRRSALVADKAGLKPLGRLGPDGLARWTALGLALTCADLVGTMRGAVALATAYAKERRQYGVAIGSFQAVQHLLADAFALIEGSRSIALQAAWAVDTLSTEEALAAGAAAKAYCARAAREVCETAIQVHGGIGNTWECLAHVFLRRALLSTDVLGGVGPSLARVLAHHGIKGGDGLR